MTKKMGGGPRTIWDDLYGRVDRNGKQLENLQSQLKVPTLPEYDSTNWPDDAVYGQIVRDFNDFNSLWVYAEDDQWHKIGGAGPPNLPMYVARGTGAFFPNGGWVTLYPDRTNRTPEIPQSFGFPPGGGPSVQINHAGIYEISIIASNGLILSSNFGQSAKYFAAERVFEITAHDSSGVPVDMLTAAGGEGSRKSFYTLSISDNSHNPVFIPPSNNPISLQNSSSAGGGSHIVESDTMRSTFIISPDDGMNLPVYIQARVYDEYTSEGSSGSNVWYLSSVIAKKLSSFIIGW